MSLSIPTNLRAYFAWVYFAVGLWIAAPVFPSHSALQTNRPASPAQENHTGISVETSQQLFATLCALDAAGFDSDESTLSELPDRLALRGDLLKMQGQPPRPCGSFIGIMLMADPAEALSRYIAFALVAGRRPVSVAR